MTLAYIQLLKVCGPLSDYQAAKALGRGVSSINSVRGGLADRVVPSDQFEISEYNTKRVKWALKE